MLNGKRLSSRHFRAYYFLDGLLASIAQKEFPNRISVHVTPIHIAYVSPKAKDDAMRLADRNAFLLILAITSGSADGWSYIGLGHAFVANMTGNTVLLGIAIFGEHGDILHPLLAIVFYAVGVTIGTCFTRRIKPDSVWSPSVSRALLLESALLIAATIGWVSAGGAPDRLRSHALLACVAAGMGIQSGALLPLRLPGVITTYITGTWTTFVSGLALAGLQQNRENDGPLGFEERLLIQAAFLAIYFLSAVGTGWAFRYAPKLIGIASLFPVLAVAGWSSLLSRRSAEIH